jgi:hypothetical protein
MPEFAEPFYGCRICGDPNNHDGLAHSAATGCECTREQRDPECTAQRFWAENIIAEAHREGRDPLAALVNQGVGAASACWENLRGAGVFDDRSAAHVADQLQEGIRQLAQVETVTHRVGSVSVTRTTPVDDPTQSSVEQELSAVLNRYSAEAPSGTPDFILAAYLLDCLRAFNEAVSRRGQWRGEPVEFTPSAVPKTPEEKRAFSRDWDARYEAGQARLRGSE